jgi:AcrR family transcriptional regulator
MIEKTKPKKRKKEAIYEAAAQLFREKGYKAASMRDLAERVDLKVSSLYSHIGSK